MIIDLTCRRIQSVDDRKNIVICEDEDSAIDFSVDHWVRLARESVSKKGSFYVALSGGSTPKKIFKKLCSSSYKEKIPWEKVFLFWSDERSVAPEDTQSNYSMAMESGLINMALHKDHIFRMHAEKDIEHNALEYEKILQNILFDETFDLIMLGMGEDGHIASLFPNTDALKEEKRLVVANYVPQKKTWRMTFTLRAINTMSHHIALYVLGPSKKKILKNVLNPKPNSPTYPAQLIGSSQVKALWITDMQTAELLKT